MKYDTLRDFDVWLCQHGNCAHGLCVKTVQVYTNRIDNLLKNQSILDNSGKSFDIEMTLKELAKLTYKNEFSQAKNALLYFLEFQKITIDKKHLDEIAELEKKTKKKYRKLKPSDFKQTQRTINHIKNEKLKQSYQVLIATGLRVAEIEQITPNDCMIDNDCIQFSFIGKGGDKESVSIQKEENERLYKDLKQRIEITVPFKKLFYSKVYLQTKAKDYGFECHDLRRAFAKLEYKKTKDKKTVSEKLRHSNVKTTDIYLKSKVKIR